MAGSKIDLNASVDSGKMTSRKLIGYGLIAAAVILLPVMFQGVGFSGFTETRRYVFKTIALFGASKP